MKDRIIKLITVEQLSYSKFADIIGVQRSSISHILSGRNKPSLDVIQKVLTKFSTLNSEWLLFGRGEMYKNKRSDLFTEKNTEEEKIETSKKTKTKETAISEFATLLLTKEVERIVIFYKDKTFKLYNPLN